MKSTLYLKFIIIYMIFGFMSLFTVATLTRTLTEEPLERNLAADVYQEANLVANEYLPHYFLGQIDESAVHTQLVGCTWIFHTRVSADTQKHDSDWTITDYINECSVYHTCSHLSVVIFHFAWNSVYRVQTTLQDNRGSETICVR